MVTFKVNAPKMVAFRKSELKTNLSYVSKIKAASKARTKEETW